MQRLIFNLFSYLFDIDLPYKQQADKNGENPKR